MPDIEAILDHQVSEADTAEAVGSGAVPVLATPRVLTLLEAATMRATAAELCPGQTTVGVRVELEHLAAIPVGRNVRAKARLESIEGRRLRFDVALLEGEKVAARGSVERALVGMDTFLAAAGIRA